MSLDAPSRYSARNLNRLLERWNGAAGQYVRQFAPRMWPGVPAEAILGFTTIGAQFEDTVDYTGVAFHEVGLYQTPAGPRSGPAPNPDPGAPNNAWGRQASSALVVQALGRPATMSSGAWRDALADQTAIGIADLLENYQTVNAGLDPSIRAASDSSLWAVSLGFSGFSAGARGAMNAIRPYTSRIAPYGDRSKFGAWLWAIAQDSIAGERFSPAGQHGNPAYTALRSWQKLASGSLLASRTGGNIRWFDLGLGAQAQVVEQAVVAAAAGSNAAGLNPLGAFPGGRSDNRLLVVAVAAGAIAWYGETRQPQWWRTMTRQAKKILQRWT